MPRYPGDTAARLRRAAELPEILEFVLEAPERCPAGRMADDEHPPIAHPRPLGIVELPRVEIVGGPASTFRSSPPPAAPPLHGPIVSGSPYQMGPATRCPNPACSRKTRLTPGTFHWPELPSTASEVGKSSADPGVVK